MEKLITEQKSVIVACDVDSLEKLGEIVTATHDISRIGGYKVGLELVIPFGLKRVVEIMRLHTEKPIIYDHQKGGTDIPGLGPKFAKAIKDCGADAVILFPFGGAATEREWIRACKAEGLTVLVGGHMTQKEFLDNEGGFISQLAPEQIYSIAAQLGVLDFVVPGNKIEFVFKYRELLEKLLGTGNFTLYAPGFIEQGGIISKTGQVAGENWHAIVGSAIYNAGGMHDMRKTALDVTSQIARTK